MNKSCNIIKKEVAIDTFYWEYEYTCEKCKYVIYSGFFNIEKPNYCKNCGVKFNHIKEE